MPIGAAEKTFQCSQDTTLTSLGIDTAAGTVLFTAAGGEGESGWVVEVRTGGEALEATAYPQPGGRRVFAGSVGPGPVFAVEDCGSACVQAVRWEAGAWTPIGEPLRAPVVSTVNATYDRAGVPWLVLHGLADGADQERPPVRAWAFRLAGREWQPQGKLDVVATGSTGAVPAAAGEEAVVSGTARFAAGTEPATWVRGLPRLPPERQGEVMPAGSGESGKGSDESSVAVYLDADGLVYLSRDGGGSWARSEWTPWGAQRARIWQPGRDYTVDVPLGDRRGSFLLAWFDRRDRAEERLILSEWRPESGTWKVTAEMPAEVLTLDGQHLNYNLLLSPRSGDWLLATGCIHTLTGSGLVLRTFKSDGAGLADAKFVPLVTANEAR